MAKKPLLSICIPTYKRPEVLRKTLTSILNQDVDFSLLEIAITDNSTTDETKDMLELCFPEIKIIKYKKTSVAGFLNSQEALKYGCGLYLKLHNDYSVFKDNTLKDMLEIIESNRIEQNEIFFSLGFLKNDKKIMIENDFNSFLSNISFYATWSSSFAMWKKDFDALLMQGIDVDFMYPHTSYLFSLTNKNKYVIDDRDYVTNIEVGKKGGYNIIDNFVRIYLTMVHDLLDDKIISIDTYQKNEKGILKFMAYWKNECIKNKNLTFTFENENKIIKNRCGLLGLIYYKIMVIYTRFR